MKINEMSTSMEKRYLAEREAEMKKQYLAEQEAEKIKAVRIKILKEVLTKLIDTFQKQIENDLSESICDAYISFRKRFPKSNKISTVLVFSLSGEDARYQTEFSLTLNGSRTRLPYQMKYDIVKQYNDFVEKYYEVADEDKGFTYEPFIYDVLYFNLNEGTVRLRHGGTKKYEEFKQDLKQAFPEALVRRSVDYLYSKNEFILKMQL